MASLDVLDFQVALDRALAQRDEEGRPLLAAPLRKQAIKDARRAIEAMAFRFALMDERPLPEDLDYLRALEAIKPAEQTARVLARRQPVYARVRRRRLTTTFVSLGIVTALIVGLVYVATLEEAEQLALVNHRQAVDATDSRVVFFNVTPEMTRLHVDGTIIVDRDSPGRVEVRLVDPGGDPAMVDAFAAGSGNYLRENVYSPEPGEWRLIVDYLDVSASARVTVEGVRYTR